ncbi:MAG: hypothetical protein V8S08_08070 [Lachnoclostridium sp.]
MGNRTESIHECRNCGTKYDNSCCRDGIRRENSIYIFDWKFSNYTMFRADSKCRAYHHANVKVVCIGGGFVYGSLGMSHQATEDLAILRALPDVVVMAPGDLVEAEECTKALVQYSGNCLLRLGRGGEKRIHDNWKILRLARQLR